MEYESYVQRQSVPGSQGSDELFVLAAADNRFQPSPALRISRHSLLALILATDWSPEAAQHGVTTNHISSMLPQFHAGKMRLADLPPCMLGT
jgi:hypothetical protein